MKSLILVILGLMLSACTPRYVWVHPEYSESRFRRDTAECDMQAQDVYLRTASPYNIYLTAAAIQAKDRTFENCMSINGWNKVEEEKYKSFLQAKKERQEREAVEHADKDRQQKADKQQALKDFETNIKPKIIEAHPDFDDIMKDEEYWHWIEKQRPALKFAGKNSGDPDDIIWALSEYKKSKSGGTP